MEDLAQVLADVRGEAAVLRRRGVTQLADFARGAGLEGAKAAEDYLVFVPETEARLRGAKLAFLRRNFPTWEQDGHARKVHGGVSTARSCCPASRRSRSRARPAGAASGRGGGALCGHA
jgi:hypothetical protein